MKNKITFLIFCFSMLAQGKEYTLYIVNDRSYPVKLELFGIKHEMPANTKYRYTSSRCFIEGKIEPGFAALLGMEKKYNAIFIGRDGERIYLVQGTPCKEEHRVILFQERVNGIIKFRRLYDKEAEAYLKKKGQSFTQDIFTRFEIQKNKIRKLELKWKETWEEKDGKRWRTFSSVWE